jgi:glycosyltransferase involved in cell wall biosynthesis
MPKVSVVIPAYNAMQYLPETVDSVLRQSFTDFELLIIDDGSLDNIKEWTFNLPDKRVKLISQTNQGLSSARNTGIVNSNGEYIAFLDADDLWEETKLEKQVNYLNEQPQVGLIHTWMLLIDEQSQPTGKIMKSYAEGKIWQQLLEKNIIACPSVMVRRRCFATVGLFDKDLRSIEDWDMWIRIAVFYPFAVIKEPLAYYRQLPNSMSKNCQIMNEAFNIVIEKAFKSAPKELLYLKNRSYGYAKICLAWKALQSINKDFKLALHFRKLAIAHYPQIIFSREYINLSLAIIAMQYLGADFYCKFLTLIYTWRRINLTIKI